MKFTLDDLALVAEYDWRFGGSQRLLSIVSDLLEKPIFLICDTPSPTGIIWNKRALVRIPEEPIILSIVVDTRKLNLYDGKQHIKFCHSRNTISQYSEDERLRNIQLVTHRDRVYEFYKLQGLHISLIKNGYILYDQKHVERNLDNKNPELISIVSRVSSDKLPIAFLEQLALLDNPINILGSIEDIAYSREVMELIDRSDNITFIEPDLQEGFSEEKKIEYLKKSSYLLHFSTGGMRDYLEYSLLDGMITGNIPICISNDPQQFSLLEQRNLGASLADLHDLSHVLESLKQHRPELIENIYGFMEHFISDQPEMEKRWIRQIVSCVDFFR